MEGEKQGSRRQGDDEGKSRVTGRVNLKGRRRLRDIQRGRE